VRNVGACDKTARQTNHTTPVQPSFFYSDLQNQRLTPTPNHLLIGPSCPARGAFRERHERWVRLRWPRELQARKRDVWSIRGRRSRVVLTPGLLASSPGEANASRGRWWQEAPIHQGEHV
jgi:hypothetical protein